MLDIEAFIHKIVGVCFVEHSLFSPVYIITTTAGGSGWESYLFDSIYTASHTHQHRGKQTALHVILFGMCLSIRIYSNVFVYFFTHLLAFFSLAGNNIIVALDRSTHNYC